MATQLGDTDKAAGKAVGTLVSLFLQVMILERKEKVPLSAEAKGARHLNLQLKKAEDARVAKGGLQQGLEAAAKEYAKSGSALEALDSLGELGKTCPYNIQISYPSFETQKSLHQSFLSYFCEWGDYLNERDPKKSSALLDCVRKAVEAISRRASVARIKYLLASWVLF